MPGTDSGNLGQRFNATRLFVTITVSPTDCFTMTTSSRRWPRRLLLALLLLAGIGLAAFQFAIHLLKGKIEQALGPRGEVKEIRVGLGSVDIVGLRLPAPPAEGKAAWPASDLLRAERVRVVPSLADLLGARVVLSSIRIEGAYLSLLRTPEQKLRLLPGLLDQPAKAPEQPTPDMPEIQIGRIELADSAVEYFDASIQRPPLKIRLEQIQVSLDNLHLPDLKGQSKLQVSGIIKGQHRDGRLEIAGQTELASKDSDIKTRLRGVDLLTFKPYLIRATDTGVKRGSMDLDVHSTVQRGRLHAPGTLTLNNLELAGGGSFMGVPQAAVVGLMKNKAGQIGINFSLDGNLNDPRFSLNEQLLGRIGAGLADSVGISLEGLAKGVGNTGSSVAKGIGDTVGKLFGK